MLTLTTHGAAGTVTGSRHLLTRGNQRILVDCGMFQGLKNLRDLNWAPFPVEPRSIGAVVLTHAHLDHSGYLPKLVADGFRGPIYATPATRAVAELILRDSGFLQEKDAEYANRRGYTKHKPARPLYGVKDAERALEAFVDVDFHEATAILGDAALTYRRAGHILGAASASIDWGGRKVVFSGDLGRYGDEVMVDPEPVEEADHIVIESTYGNRIHDQTDPAEALATLISRTAARGGTVVIPAFAVGRAQSLLYYIWKLKQGGWFRDLPVYLDSPMAINASELLCTYPNDHRMSADTCRDACAIATYVRDVEKSKAITANPYPKIVISASGMATGGRVLHHIRAFAPDRRNLILFSGFQAAGTRGRSMVDGASEVKMFGESVPVGAEVANLAMLSAHADAGELLRWMGGFRSAPKHVTIVHGEPEAAEALRVKIKRELGWRADAARQDQEFTL
ncbi:MBL fold metallo-hydrolase RNA specificity domain-containing protein [Cypionkella psychrotolerans]|uniref:MBL fold metallo-hydrolase RNA specificity domain-containing protein n=1 Tax=Cypionkella psychrotolerans TaxID=1678131 RepID=UPI0006B548E0|nr:MBL fold metallo-hydrolase [Cypionkella psychrotolerans]